METKITEQSSILPVDINLAAPRCYRISSFIFIIKIIQLYLTYSYISFEITTEDKWLHVIAGQNNKHFVIAK